MSVPSSYLTSTKNTAGILEAMQKASVPERVTYEFLKQLGFPSSGDRPMIPVLKSIGFLNDGAVPTESYRRFKDKAISKGVLAQGIRDGYADVFAIDPEAYKRSSQDLSGIFARLSDKGETVTAKMASTFKALAGLADFQATGTSPTDPTEERPRVDDRNGQERAEDAELTNSGVSLSLRHDVHVHLPLTTDVAVYDAIFKSLKANLL
jgi:hypothetical protein